MSRPGHAAASLNALAAGLQTPTVRSPAVISGLGPKSYLIS
jgi:hypothetical protein